MRKFLLVSSMVFMGACSVTNQAKQSDVQYSGFLANYSDLRPTDNPQEALDRYINPQANWSSYHAIRLEPVSFWAAPNSTVSLQAQQMLTDYAYQKLVEDLTAKGIRLTDVGGSGVLVIRAALTDIKSATPVLRTISVVVPQARLLSAASSLVTGQYAFVGSIQTEGEALDGVTGQREAAWVDKRFGGQSIKNAGGGQWGDAKNAIDLWASLLANRFVALKQGNAN
jgi:hypothetical protein